jgi:hypothetical protein
MPYTPWSGVTAVECKRYAQVTYDQLGFASDEEFNSWINDVLIAEAESHVEAYCLRDFSEDFTNIPEAVKGVIRRTVANAIQVAVLNRAGPLIRVGDYRVEWADRTILTDDLKQLLNPFVKQTRISKATEYVTEDLKKTWGE